MKKRWISLLLVSAMTLSMLAGCGSSEDTAEDTSEGGEGDKITFMVPDWGVPTDEQLAAFTEETGIEVEIAEVGWDDIREKIATAASANECAADVVEVDWSWVGEFYAADWLEPLEVSDEGKALTEEEFEKLNEPLQSKKIEGLGLGLAIIRQIISNHKGKLIFSRRSPNGITAKMILPLEKAK